MNSFYLLNEKIFYYTLTIQLLMKYQKILTVVHIVIQDVDAVQHPDVFYKKVFLEIS